MPFGSAAGLWLKRYRSMSIKITPEKKMDCLVSKIKSDATKER